jgi:hypothetical protein
MSRWTVAVPAALAGLLALAVVAQTVRLNRLDRDLEHTRAKVERLEARHKESAAASQAAVEQVRGEIARVEQKAAEEKAAPPAPAKPGGSPPVLSEEDLQKFVDDRVEQKLRAPGGPARGSGQGGERKMPLHDLAKELGLDPATQAKVAGIANTAKKEIFEVIKTPRPDGTCLADDLIAAVTGGNAEDAQKVFSRIFTEKIPGTDTTYVTAVARIQEDARARLRAALGDATYERYQHMHVNPDHIETGYDPLAEYFVRRQGK